MNGASGAQRMLIWGAIVCAAIYAASYMFLLRFLPPPSPSLAATEVAALYQVHNTAFRVGVVLMIMTGAFYLPFAVVVSLQMARHEGAVPVWSVLQGLASTVGAWIFAFPPVLWGVAAFSPDRDPAITLLMHEFAWLAFVTPASFFTWQLIPIIVVALRGGPRPARDPFPRWIGYLTIWCVIAGDLAVLPMAFRTGVFAWNGLIGFWTAVVVFTTWFGVMCNRMLWAAKAQGMPS